MLSKNVFAFPHFQHIYPWEQRLLGINRHFDHFKSFYFKRAIPYTFYHMPTYALATQITLNCPPIRMCPSIIFSPFSSLQMKLIIQKKIHLAKIINEMLLLIFKI